VLHEFPVRPLPAYPVLEDGVHSQILTRLLVHVALLVVVQLLLVGLRRLEELVVFEVVLVCFMEVLVGRVLPPDSLEFGERDYHAQLPNPKVLDHNKKQTGDSVDKQFAHDVYDLGFCLIKVINIQA